MKNTEESTRPGFIRVPVEKAEEAVEQADVLLDIREPEEFEAGHIKGAINIPKGTLAFKLGEIPGINSPQAKIIVYCTDGKRCVSVALTLMEMGYQNVYALGGGLNAWLRAGHAITK